MFLGDMSVTEREANPVQGRAPQEIYRMFVNWFICLLPGSQGATRVLAKMSSLWQEVQSCCLWWFWPCSSQNCPQQCGEGDKTSVSGWGVAPWVSGFGVTLWWGSDLADTRPWV